VNDHGRLNDHERYEQWDAAYLLGALSPAERREYEDHLAGCERCSSTVAALAAMPALLSELPADDALALVTDHPVTPTASVAAAPPAADLLPRLLARLRRRRLARRWILGGIGALAAAAVVAALVLPPALGGTGPRAEGQPTTTIALQQAAAVPLTAQVDLTTVPWGTRVAMTCTYETNGSHSYTHRYALYVVPRTGEPMVVSTWNAAPGQTVRTTGSMALPVAAVERIELRDASTQDVLLSRVVK
jgi:hypothetical protein